MTIINEEEGKSLVDENVQDDEGEEVVGDESPGHTTTNTSTTTTTSTTSTTNSTTSDNEEELHPDIPGGSILDGKRKLLFSSDVDGYITAVDVLCRKVAIKVLIMWIILVLVSYVVGYATNRLEKLEGAESLYAAVASFVLLVSVIFNMIPYTFTKKGVQQELSGVLICAFTVQGIALTTDLLLCIAQVPVFLDPIMGTRVFMLRWSEWTVLAYMMTFLTEVCQHESMAVDERRIHKKEGLLQSIMNVMNYEAPTEVQNMVSPKKHHLEERLKPAYDLALSQALSTFCGFLFPFCPQDGIIIWAILFIISTAAFSLIFFRYNTRKKKFECLIKGDSVGEKEMYGWAEISLQLLKTCAGMWTTLVLSYIFYTVGPNMFPEYAIFRIKGLNMMFECVLDVLFKSIYLSAILHVHNIIFDPFARAERRLEELRQASIYYYYQDCSTF